MELVNDTANDIGDDQPNEFLRYSLFGLDLKELRFIDDELLICQRPSSSSSSSFDEKKRFNVNDGDGQLTACGNGTEDESVSNRNCNRALKKKLHSSSNVDAETMHTSTIGGCGAAVGGINSLSLPRRCKEPYAVDVSLRGNNKRSVCPDDNLISSASGSNFQGCGNSESYQLSADFQQKQVEILSRKYGGGLRARRAAVVIQRAFRKHSMTKKFERLRKRHSASGRHMSKLFVSNIEIDANDFKCERYKVDAMPWNSVKVARLDDATRPEDSGEQNRPPPTRSSVSNRTDVAAAVIGVKAKDYNGGAVDASSSEVRGDVDNCRQQSRGHRPRQKSTTTSVERTNQYAATTHLNVTPAQSNSFKVVTLSSEAKVVDKHKTNNNGASVPLSPPPISAESDAQYVSYVRVGGSGAATTTNDQDPNDVRQSVAGARAATATEDDEELKHRMKLARATDDQDNKPSALVDQFYSPIKLHEKAAAAQSTSPVQHSKSSTTDKCTLSSSSSSCVALSHSASSPAASSKQALSPLLQGVVSESSSSVVPSAIMSPIWKPRNATPVKVVTAVHLSEASGTWTEDFRQSNPTNSESRVLYHWAWGRPTAYRASLRRTDVERRRQYRIALNFFNKKPERGVEFLICWNFVEGNALSVAKFLITRKGISKQMIGEYLGNLQNPFNMAVLDCFVGEVDMRGMEIDMALRKFQSLFRLPGEAQKIERIMEVFARRYCQCNPEAVKQFRQPDTVFVLAFATIMLNTDLHSPSIKAEKRMKVEDFIKNLRGIDGGCDIEHKYLTELYHRVKVDQFKAGTDHVAQVIKVERNVVGKKPTLALPHRRLVCYCRLYEIADPSKKQSPSAHQREIFLFNDMMLITKILSRKKNVVTYNFRLSHCLVGMQAVPFRNQHYANGLQVNHTLENKTLYFNARNEDDRTKFVDDLKEAILESDEMEALRIELELEKQNGVRYERVEQQRDSGLADVDAEHCHFPESACLYYNNLSNSLLDLAEQRPVAPANNDQLQRHPSGTSLDSGMSSASIGSHESSPRVSRPSTTTDDRTPTSPTSLQRPKSATRTAKNNVGFAFSDFFGKNNKNGHNNHDIAKT